MFKVQGGNSEYVVKSIRIPKDMCEWLEKIARDNNISFNNLVTQCVEYALNHDVQEKEHSRYEKSNTNCMTKSNIK